MITVNVPHESATVTFPDGTAEDVIRKTMERDFPVEFDPEGSGYDYKTAREAGIEADETGHWPSLDPRTGMVLKGKGHESIDKTYAAEEELGNEIYQQGGRYFSQPKPKDKPFTGASPEASMWGVDDPGERPVPDEQDWAPKRTMLESSLRPFENLAYKAAESVNTGMASFSQNLDNLSGYVGEKFGMEPGGGFEKGVEFYLENAEYWRKKSEDVGTDVVNDLIGEAIGGAGPGIAEFMLNVPYHAMMGAAEAHEKGDSEIVGAVTEGAKRFLVGKVLHQTGVLKQPLRSGAMGGVFAGQTVGEGGSKEDVAKAFGTGALYGIGGKGKLDARGVFEALKKQKAPGIAGEFGQIPAAERPDIVARPGPPRQIRVAPEQKTALIQRAFEGKTARGKELLLTGGPPGAGKSTVLEMAGIGKEGKGRYVIADADMIKEWAGYENRAAEFHEESSSINKEIADRAIEGEVPLIYDSLLSSFVQAQGLIKKQLAKGSDANVSIAFTHIDADTSMSRAKQRMLMGLSEREIPAEVSLKGYNRSLPTFIELYKRYRADPRVDFYLVDNNVDGRAPVTVFKKEGGRVTILDKNMFDKLINTEYVPIEGGEKFERKDPRLASQINEKALEERARKAVSLAPDQARPAEAVVEKASPKRGPPSPEVTPKQPVEPQASKGPDKKVTPKAKGSSTTIQHADGSEPVRYEVWDLGDVVPSHDPAKGFAKDPRYPKDTQERAYHKNKAIQIEVLSHAKNYEPSFVVSDNPDSVNGPPIVTRNGVVLGGNSRAMTLAEVYDKYPEHGKAYKDMIASKAGAFGLDPKALEKVERPILVRVLKGEVADMPRKVRLFNQSFTQGLDVKAEGVSRARMVSETTMDIVGDALEKHHTIRKYLANQDSRRIVTALTRDGIIEKTQQGRLINSRTGLLTEDGKRLVEQTLRGKIVDDFDLLDALEATPGVLQKIDRILPAMSRLKARGDAWDISEQLKQALDDYTYYKSAGFKTPDQFLAQSELFKSQGKQSADPVVEALFRAMEGDGQVQIAKRFNEYAEAAQRDVKGQGVLPMFKVETPGEAFKRVFGGEPTETAPKKTGTFAMKADQPKITTTAEGMRKDLFGGDKGEQLPDPNSKQFNRYMEAIKKEPSEVIKEYKKRTGSALPMVLTNAKGDRGGLIHQSTKSGKYQLSTWDDRGFVGDTQHDTLIKAVEEAYQDYNFKHPNPEAFKKISKTPEFLETLGAQPQRAKELAMKADQGDLFGGFKKREAKRKKTKEEEILERAAKLLDGKATFKYKPTFGSKRKAGKEPDKQQGLFGEKPKKGQGDLFAKDLETAKIPPVPAVSVDKPPEGVSRSAMIKAAEKALKIPIRVGKIRGKDKAGIYKPHEKVARVKKANDVEVAMHEAGHHIRRLMGLPEEMPKEIQNMAYAKAKGTPLAHEEGFAEFFRKYVTKESEAKAQAPEYYKEFTKALEKHKDVQDLVVQTRQTWNQWVALPSVQKVMSVIQPGHTKGLNLPTWNDVYTDVKDALHPIKVARELAEKRGHKFDPKEDPYILARTVRAWSRQADQYLRWGTFQFQETGPAVKFTGKSYLDIIKPVEKAGMRHLFDAYVVARRARSDKRILEGFDRVLTKEDFDQTFGELHETFKGTAKELDKYNGELIDFLVASGRITEELGKGIKTKNPFYTPFYRVMDADSPVGGLSSKKFSQVVNPIKRMKGSSRDIISPTESILYNTYAIMNSASRNRVGEALAKLAKKEGMGDVIEKVPVKLRPQKMSLPEAVSGMRKMLERAGTEKAAGWEEALVDMMGHQKQVKKLIRELAKAEKKGETLTLDQIEGAIEKAGMTPEDMFLLQGAITTFRPNYTPGPNEAIFYNKGKPEVYELSPQLAKAVTNIDASSIGLLTKVLSVPAKTLRAGATVFSPEFGIRNPVRDQLVAFIQSKYGFKPGLDLMRGIYHIMKKDKLWQEYNASGAAMAHVVSVDRDYLSKNLRELINKSTVKHMVTHPLEIIQKISEFGEEGTRLGEFARAYKKEGGDLNALLKSAIAAKEVSVDFGRLGGPTARSINLITAFWNARLEGLDQMKKTFKEQPAQASARAFLAVTLPSILTWYYQKDDPYYNELPPWRRALMWNYVFHNDDGSLDWVLSIPKPFEYGLLFGTLPEASLDWAYTKDPEGMKEALVQIAKTLELAPIPTGVIPIGEWWANKSWFFDRPIVTRDTEKLEPVLQYGTRTSETVKLVAEIMDKVPGLRGVASPAKIENLIRGYTAAAGRLSLEAGDHLLEVFGAIDTPPGPSWTLSDIPGLRAFSARFPSSNSASVERFYKRYEATKRTWESGKQRAGVRGYGLKIGTPKALKDMERAAKALSTLRKIVKLTHKSRVLTPEAKRETLDNLYLAMINVARAQLDKANLK